MNCKFVIKILILFSLVGLWSCNQEKKAPEGSQPTEFEENLVNEDSIQVQELVSTYFSYVIDKRFTDAVSMLYVVNEEGEPEVLDNEQMAEVRNMLELFPIVDYRIEYIKFFERTSNEVLCYCIMQKAEGDMPEMSTKMFFKPVQNAGNWYLCLTDTGLGDRGVVDPEDRDSVINDYQNKYND